MNGLQAAPRAATGSYDGLMIRRRVRVHGLVQGVFFRYECSREAEARGVGGWVRNLPDGSVEAVFEGSEPAVEAMTAWAGHGPSGARVRKVEESEEPTEGLRDFRIVG